MLSFLYNFQLGKEMGKKRGRKITFTRQINPRDYNKSNTINLSFTLYYCLLLRM